MTNQAEQILNELRTRIEEIEWRCRRDEITDSEALKLMGIERKIADRKMREYERGAAQDARHELEMGR